MNRFYYDLHIHSCLSPCADNDMTPLNIAGMAKLNGLDIIALTDHNSAKNCAAFESACELNGIVSVCGMELTTAEDIHLVCLFEHIEEALRFDEALQEKRTLIPNRPDIAGEQLIYGDSDESIGTEPYLLPVATSLSLEEARDFANGFNAVIYPAHTDRTANGIVAILGDFPENSGFRLAEFRSSDNVSPYRDKYRALENIETVTSSDAHYLWDISEKVNSIELNCAKDAPHDEIRAKLFACLRG